MITDSDAVEHLESLEDEKRVQAVQTAVHFGLLALRDFGTVSKVDWVDKRFDEFSRVIELIPECLQFHDYPRLFVLANFWLEFYTISKYGHEKIGISSEKIFKKEEAQLALQHADACNRAANAIKSWHELGRKQ